MTCLISGAVFCGAGFVLAVLFTMRYNCRKDMSSYSDGERLRIRKRRIYEEE